MSPPEIVLRYICYASAALGLAGYVYGYILNSRGDRRWHTGGLLFSIFALAAVPTMFAGGAGGEPLNAALVVSFLLLSVLCQAVTSLRGRQADRRAPREAAAVDASDGASAKAQ